MMKNPCLTLNRNPKFGVLKIGVLAALLTAVGLVLQFGFGAEPCTMCWWQRYVHWGLLLVASGALLIKFDAAKALSLVIILALLGLGIAVWQSAGQLGWVELPAVCGGNTDYIAVGAADLLASLNQGDLGIASACDDKGMTILGLTLAMWNIVAMLVVLVIAAIAWPCGLRCPWTGLGFGPKPKQSLRTKLGRLFKK